MGEVDTLGTLRVLRDPEVWREVKAAEEGDAKKRRALQIDVDNKAEAAFVSDASSDSVAVKGGTLGGISSGTNIMFHVAVKAVATIGQAQPTVTYDGEETVLEAKGRHDPCVLPRTPPLVEGMTALVLIDAALMQRTRLGGSSTVLCDGSEPGPVHEAIIAERARKAGTF